MLFNRLVGVVLGEQDLLAPEPVDVSTNVEFPILDWLLRLFLLSKALTDSLFTLTLRGFNFSLLAIFTESLDLLQFLKHLFFLFLQSCLSHAHRLVCL